MSRYDVLARYARSLKQTCRDEIAHLKARAVRVDPSDGQALAAHTRSTDCRLMERAAPEAKC